VPPIKYSIIIPTISLNKELHKCLEAIIKSKTVNKSACELILILDGVPIDRSFFADFNDSNVQILSLKSNKGPAYARNQGAKIAKGDVLFFVDADVVIQEDTLKKLSQHFETDQPPDAVIGSYDDQPEDQSLVSKFRNLLHHFTHQQAANQATTFWTGCGAIKSSVFNSVEGFDDAFISASVEDIELGYRLIHNNYTIRLDKTLQVKHLKKWSLFNMIKTDILKRSIPWTILLYNYKHWEIKDLNINSEERAAVFLLGLVILFALASWIYPLAILVSLMLMASLIILKRKAYLFFFKHFSLLLPFVILLHWIYLLSAAIGWIIGTLIYISRRFSKQGT